MKKQTLGIAVLAFLLILSATAIVPNTGAEGTATIWTDKPDYYPGDTVTIFGAGFLPDNTVLIKVTRPDYSIDSWTVTSDAGGYFTTTYQLDGMTGTYLVLAIDPVTDQTLASTSFTDSIQSTLEGWDIEPPKIGWTTGNVKGWREDGWVPYHFKIKGLAKNTDYNIVIAVDYFLPDSSGTYYYNSTAGWYGIDAQRHWNYTWTYNDDNPMSGTSITPDMKVVATSGFYEAQYTWHVNTEERTELTLWWENHIAIGAHNWPGAKIHVRTAFGGHSDVPIEVVARAPSTTMTKLSAETITLGQSVTDTATVTDGGGMPTPTGTVTFYVGSSTTGPWTQFASKSLSGGTAYADYLPLAAGDYYFNVTYSGDSNYQPSKSDPATEHLVVTPAPSTTATVLNATEIVLGEGVRDTATVTGLGGSFPVPTGTVTFYVGSSTTGPWTQFASKSLSGGTAYADYLPLAAGDYYFNVTYSGDSNYQPSKSDPATEHLVVTPAPSTTATVLNATEIVLGEGVRDTATVTGLGGSFPVPTGTVTFYVGSSTTGPWTQFASKSLSGGTAYADYLPLAAGDYYFNVTYSGDSNYQPSKSDPATEHLVVTPAPSTTATVLNATEIVLGEGVRDTATVTGLGGSFPVPTGTVTFYVGSSTTGPWTQFASKSLSGGTAYADYLPLAAGDYYFNVTYSGDSNYQPSKSDPATEHLVVTPAPSTTATVLNATEIVLGEGVRDTATVTGLGGSFPVPTGTVTFYVGSSTTGPWTQFASKSLSGGTAYADYLPLAAGDYYFNVTYSGDSNYQPSKSDPATEHLVVTPAPSTTATVLNATEIVLGEGVRDTATVTGLGGSFPVPTGTVTFYVGSSTTGPWTQFASKSLSGGTAYADYLPLAAGDYYFNVTYSGDSNYQPSKSDPATEHLVVTPAPSTTATVLNATEIVLGEGVRDTATVTGLGGSFPVPTGTVTFYVGSSTTGPWTQFASKSLSGGTAYADYLPLAAGDYYFNVTYSGDSNYQPSKSDPATEHLVVTPAPSTTATVLNATEIVLGEGVRDTATVTGLGGSFPVPTGTVTFYVGSSTTGPWTQFASKSLSGGTAYADYLPLAAGDYYFNVTYSGDSNYQPSKSDPATEHLVVVIPVTRTQGFWATHTAITCSVFSDKLGGKIDIGTKPGHYKNITKCGDLMGAFWSSIPRKTDGTRRSAIDQARMILVQQLIAAILNHAAFGTPVPIDSVTGKDLITAGNLAYGGNDKAEMLRVAKLLDDFNKSGDGYPLPPWMTPPGPATPRESREMADRVFWDTL
jgi:hypothetical protein